MAGSGSARSTACPSRAAASMRSLARAANRPCCLAAWIRPARPKSLRRNDSVGDGTASRSAISPTGMPSCRCRTSRRNTAGRVACARAMVDHRRAAIGCAPAPWRPRSETGPSARGATPQRVRSRSRPARRSPCAGMGDRTLAAVHEPLTVRRYPPHQFARRQRKGVMSDVLRIAVSGANYSTSRQSNAASNVAASGIRGGLWWIPAAGCRHPVLGRLSGRPDAFG